MLSAPDNYKVRSFRSPGPLIRAAPHRTPGHPPLARRMRAEVRALDSRLERRYAGSLPDGRYEVIDSAHLIQAEQPQLLATRIQELFQAAAT